MSWRERGREGYRGLLQVMELEMEGRGGMLRR
jgi:hypothetical protein